MNISAISDVHVKAPHDPADQLLCRFLDHSLVRSSDIVLLLGDIFDLMSGNHEEYLRDFAHIFTKMDELLKSGKKIYFFEGNHDVHLKGLFKKYWKSGEFIPLQYPVVENFSGKSYYFSHGDELDLHNTSYQRYKRFLLSGFVSFAADYLMPYSVLNYIGRRASNHSRKKGSRSFNESLVQERFRSGMKEVTQGAYDFVIGGHSHVRDLFKDGRTTYVNNGYALKTRSFVSIRDHHVTFEEL
jgi:UDP-2,3-diacylglucosamine hydrolase